MMIKNTGNISKGDNAPLKTDYLHSNFVEVNGARIHYIEQGKGKPILFIHGMPSSSYLWRNIIPHLIPYGRCIALDLIGHGQSESPEIEFNVRDHLDYLTKFIEILDLEDILIVGHSWGITLGIAYAKNNEKNVRGLSYLEPMLGSWDSWEEFNPDNPQAQEMFKKFRSKEGWDLIVNQNIFLEKIFVNASVRKLLPEEKENYIKPFKSIARRKAAWKAPQELPIAGSPKEVVELVDDNFIWQKQTQIPQLFFYTKPAAFFTTDQVKELGKIAPSVSLYYLGKGIYNHAEDYPDEIGKGIAEWLINNYSLDKAIPKFSLYTNIHKAIRKEIFLMCILAGSIDFYDKTDSQMFLQQFKRLLSLLRDHSKHEDTFIHPLLEKISLVKFNLLHNEHEELEKKLIDLEKLLNQLLDSNNKTICLEYSNNFYLEFCQFASNYLQHLYFEEIDVMNTLHKNYDQFELLTVLEQFKKSQSLEETKTSLEGIFSAINPHETLFLLSSIQKAVPCDLFSELCELAKKSIAERDWEKIDATLLSTTKATK
ncbi:Haloalkane dehalogenase [Legionella sp. PC1000]|uniref:haloalkane dehalogenase n=1 Tax=Legionella sp. PC1000 TaxID=2746060 RepID=UPI00185FC23A|nr:haloalkane dehalogenase [Legionella sp. PC1000]QLZ69333.1 Haloalkane dehalogenase [Legionella sp. PC1000]